MSHRDDVLTRRDQVAAGPALACPASETVQADERAGGAGARARALHPKLEALLAGGPPDRHRILRFLSRDRFPLVERDAVTFVFRGEADAVYLHHFMRGLPNGLPFQRVAGTRLWHLRFPITEGSRFEYKLDVVRNAEGRWINDPLNPRTASDPFGANSVGWSFGYAPPDWTRPDPDAPAGHLETLTVESRAFAETRGASVYLPAGFAEDRVYPAVFLHDGADFVDHASLVPALDNLIHRGDVPPLVAVLMQPGERNGEYTGDPRHADFVTDELLPAVRARFPVSRGPEGCVLMGSSLGAVASISTAFRHPGVWGALALKSGSFIFDRKLLETRDPLFARVADFVDRMRDEPSRLPDRIFIGCGIYEGLIEQNRHLARFLGDRGGEVRLLETRDAHHWQNWRDQLRASLRWTLLAQPD